MRWPYHTGDCRKESHMLSKMQHFHKLIAKYGAAAE
jgi:hypothetical protein